MGDVDGCDACEIAIEAVLGSVTVVTNDGACDAQAAREGDTVRFGHGTNEVSEGVNELWIYKQDQLDVLLAESQICLREAMCFCLSNTEAPSQMESSHSGLPC